MTHSWDKDAETLQTAVVRGEDEKIERGLDYDDAKVRVNTVHARQDLLLIVSHMSRMCSELFGIRILLTLIFLLLLVSQVRDLLYRG